MPNLKNSQRFFLAFFSGFLMSLIFPRWNMDYLAWLALIPLFFAIDGQTPRRSALYGFCAGVVFYFCGLSWITVTLVNYGNQPPALSWVCLGFLVFYLSGYIALFCYLGRLWSKNLPFNFFLLAPPLWTALEYIRSTHSEYGFSWLGLGYSQFENLPIIQFSQFTGVYGISALIVLVNAAIFYFAKSFVSPRGNHADFPLKHRLTVAGSSLAMAALCLGFGLFSLKSADHQASGPTLKIALAQGNIEQKLKWDPLYRQRINQTYRDLSLKASESSPDLIVWPEAATPFFFTLEPRETEALRNLARTLQIPMLFGSPYQEDGPTGPILYNRAYYIGTDGDTVGTYDKIHLVPFGEFVPFRKMLWFVNKLVEMVGDFGHGERAPILALKNNFHFSISICYEVTFPDLVRLPVKEGAEFLVNITNDAWYGRSAASYQHMSMVAMRAVENQVPIVRAANTGITGTIDAQGKIHHATDLFVEDLVVAEISPSRRGPTFYSRNGDIFSLTCILASFGLALWIRTRRI